MKPLRPDRRITKMPQPGPLKRLPRRFLNAVLGLFAALVLLSGCRHSEQSASVAVAASVVAEAPSAASAPPRLYTKPPADVIKRRLTPLEYEVTQHAATEPPFQNRFWDNHDAGLYVDVVTGEPLFSSRDKFDSGTGWPSFSQPVAGADPVTHEDETLGMTRTEVRSRVGDSHLGHLFKDGPAPTGLRYCMNSAALRFIPVKDLAQQGYASYAPLFADTAGVASQPPASASSDPAVNSCTRPAPGEKAGCSATLDTAILAGGCFWGMQEILRKIPGVLETEAGYTGGNLPNPSYEDVHTGRTGHAEAVRVVFDPTKISYSDLLEKWFFRMHDPTTLDRQGNDVGSQYRSAIFYTSSAQRDTAEAVKKKVNASGKWKAPIVTEISAAGAFTRAEEGHQDYLQKNPGGYTCHYLRD